MRKPERKPDWQLSLMQYLAQAASTPFVPGQHDCALFAAGAVQAMTGRDLAEGWRGSYSSLAEGLVALRRAGHADHIALVASHLPELAPAFARPGDLAVVPSPDGLALGVFQGEMIYVLKPEGLGAVSRLYAIRAFEVA